MTLPAPFLSAHVDLRDFQFMPVDITRLFGSEFQAGTNDSIWRAGVTLWLKSYHQVPAASLPDDDVALARLAELGRDVKTWKKLRAGALRGWTKCSDGRLYHRVVAEKALEAWIEKVAQRKVSAAGNCKRYKQEFDPAPFDADIAIAREQLKAMNPQSRMLARKGGKYAPGPLSVSPNGTPDGTPSGSNVPSPNGSPAGVPREVKREVEREEKESKSLKVEGKKKENSRRLCAADELARFMEIHPRPINPDAVHRRLSRLLEVGVSLDDICAGATSYRAEVVGKDQNYTKGADKWLADGCWKSAVRQAKPAVPTRLKVNRFKPNGEAWGEYILRTTGQPVKWILGGSATYFPSEWPPTQADERGAA